MSRKKLGMTTILSLSDGNLLGIVSDGDLRRLLEREGPHALEHTRLRDHEFPTPSQSTQARWPPPRLP